MSIVADFAHNLNQEFPPSNVIKPEGIEYQSKTDKLYEVRAVIFDVYGTLINYWKPEFSSNAGRQEAMIRAFGRVIDLFGFESQLLSMAPDDAPSKTLFDLYHGLIALEHEKGRKKGHEFPEVKIEQVWRIIIMMLQRHGFDTARLNLGDDSDVALCCAYSYNFFAFKRGLYSGIVDTLQHFKKRFIKCGILSNAQFYTPIDLTLFLREQSNDDIDDYLELFHEDLVFYSYEYGAAKPSRHLYEKLYDALYELHILPSETVFVGNDLVSDIQAAQNIGMRTALYCGDSYSLFLHDQSGKITPDITFMSYAELPFKLLFQGQPKAGL